MTTNITAVVTVADDGGSSGRLRRSLGIPPPGDLRNCLAALSDDESLLTQLFQYRFAEGDGLHGHAFGNLFVTAMAGVTGSFERGLLEASRVLSIRGKVVPSTLASVTLEGELVEDRSAQVVRVSGESQIQERPGAIWRVWLSPEKPPANPEAVQAILTASLVLIGPGSLFTSVIPNLLIPGIRDALQITHAQRVYICNIVTQPGETEKFNVRDHLRAIEQHIGFQPFDLVLAHQPGNVPLPEDMEWVHPEPILLNGTWRLQDLADTKRPGYHDTKKLTAAIRALAESPAKPNIQ